MTIFKVGEIAVGTNHRYTTAYNGLECVIVEGLRVRRGRSPLGQVVTVPAYLVKWADGSHSAARPKFLRKKQPPATDESTARQAMLDCIQRAMQPQGVV